MFERFADDTRQVVVRAVDEARAGGQPRVGTEHLLLAIAAGKAGVARQVLLDAGAGEPRVREAVRRRAGSSPGAFSDADSAALAAFGIDLDAVLDRIKDRLGDEPAPPPRGSFRRTQMSPHAKKALQLGLREAIWLKDRAIRSEHLLLGILRAGDGRACLVLDDLGVDRDDLHKSLVRAAAEAA